LRFSVVLIAGIILVSVFYLMPFAFPSYFWSFPLWPLLIGFVPGLVVGASAKDLGRGIVGGLISVFLGPMIGTLLFFSVTGALNFVIGGLYHSFWLSSWACLLAAAGGALGALITKNAQRMHEFMTKRKRTTTIVIALVGLLLMTPVASVMLLAEMSHLSCDGLVRLLEDQYYYEVTEEPMQFREEAFQPHGSIKLVDCGSNDEKFASELLNTTNVSKLCYFKTPTGAYLWFLTGSRDRLVYVRYGFWQFEPITHGFGIPWWWFLIVFVLPTSILMFVAAISAKIEKPKEIIAAPQLRPFPMDKYPEELANRYQRIYPHNPAGVLEFHISRKMKEGKTREQAIEELIKESG